MIARLNYYIQSFVINNPTYRRLYLTTLKKFVFIVFNYSKFFNQQDKKATVQNTIIKYKIQSKSYMAKYVFVYTPDMRGYLP